MSIFSYASPDKIARFAAAVRQEGWRVALAKTRAYIAMRRGGRGRSALPGAPAGSPQLNQSYLAGFWLEIARREAFHATAAPATLRRGRRIAMIGDLNLPQCRKYRVEQPAEIWAAEGVEYGYAHYEDVPRCTALMQTATHLMFYRAFNGPLTSMYLYEARRLKLPVLYDLDDPLFSVSAYETYGNMSGVPAALKAHFLREAPRYNDAINLADIVSMSTPALAGHTRLYTSRPVHVRRNFADRATLQAGARAAAAGRERPGFRIAFASGSMGHEVDFETISADLADFLAAAPDRELLILGHFDTAALPPEIAARAETRKFSDYDGYLAALAGCDVAAMPLTDDVFNRCKSAVRVLDAAAVGVPSLVGTVSDMAAVVRDGATGRVLGPDDSWRAALEDLAADAGAPARAMGQAARADLEETWSARAAPPVIDAAILDWVRA